MTSADVLAAEKLFGAISQLTVSQLPQSRLLSLLGETRSVLSTTSRRVRGRGTAERSGSPELLNKHSLEVFEKVLVILF